ncbi:hypothetical protein ACWD6P_11930 [Streptomyces sp. NPDC002446]
MPSQVRSHSRRVPRTLLRAGLVVSAAGAAIAAGGAATASADTASFLARNTDTSAAAKGVHTALRHSAAGGLGPVKNIQLNPMANTAVDPLNNGVATKVADFKPMSTTQVTGFLSDGAALRDVPLAGSVARALPE